MSSNIHGDGLFAYGPADEMKKRFGWTAENRRVPVLRPEVVPENIRDLIPFAQRWGVSCDVTRHDVASKATQAELDQLKAALNGRHEHIEDFLFVEEDENFNEEQSTFMAMLIFEAEECGGPGIKSDLTVALRRYRAVPSPERLASLAGAYRSALPFRDASGKDQELNEAKSILDLAGLGEGATPKLAE